MPPRMSPQCVHGAPFTARATVHPSTGEIEMVEECKCTRGYKGALCDQMTAGYTAVIVICAILLFLLLLRLWRRVHQFRQREAVVDHEETAVFADEALDLSQVDLTRVNIIYHANEPTNDEDQD